MSQVMGVTDVLARSAVSLKAAKLEPWGVTHRWGGQAFSLFTCLGDESQR